MSIKQVALERQKFRAECRVVADEIMALILEKLDKVPEAQQGQVVAMVMTELQIATRKANPKDG